ncbi:hypothetical protein VTP01DRAFT_6364 [Rhizomucor pusillus]|uniref:uncharacterized protein n=1 Tax=Rhizomucor pusillus TaxID=4840 RepID=UPI0037440053
MKTLSPLPHWLFAKDLARHALVVFVDEYKTSITCAFGDNELIPYRDMNGCQCEHKYDLTVSGCYAKCIG